MKYFKDCKEIVKAFNKMDEYDSDLMWYILNTDRGAGFKSHTLHLRLAHKILRDMKRRKTDA